MNKNCQMVRIWSVNWHIDFQDDHQYFVKTVNDTTQILDKLEPLI